MRGHNIKRVSSAKRFDTKYVIIFLLLVISTFSLGTNLFFYKRLQSENTVVEVVDGDTFQLSSGKRVRLMGVDAPEIDRCGGREAKERLTELISNKNVTLSEETTEAYGRSLALVYIGNTFVNKIMLEQGLARTDYRKNSQRDALTSAYHTAKEAKIGIFSSLCRQQGEIPAGKCLIKGNIDKNTYEKFYHLPECNHYNEVVIDQDLGEGYFCSEQQAIESGFRKAAGCL